MSPAVNEMRTALLNRKEDDMNHTTSATNRAHQALPASRKSEVSEASLWDESQIQAVIRHAGQTGRSPEEFFNKKWKRVLCRRAS